VERDKSIITIFLFIPAYAYQPQTPISCTKPHIPKNLYMPHHRISSDFIPAGPVVIPSTSHTTVKQRSVRQHGIREWRGVAALTVQTTVS